MKTVGVRELKAKLSAYLRLAQDGESIVVTQRGRPVVELRAVSPAVDDRQAVLDDLERLGLLFPGTGRAPALGEPVESRGGPLDIVVVDDRQDRF